MDGEFSLVFDRPIDEVFVFLANLENDAAWRREFVEGNRTSEGPIVVGSEVRMVGKGPFGSGQINVVFALTEYEPNRSASWKTVGGPLPMTVSRTFESVDGGTRVTMRYEMEARGALKLLEPIVMRFGRRQVEGDLPKLKELLNAVKPA